MVRALLALLVAIVLVTTLWLSLRPLRAHVDARDATSAVAPSHDHALSLVSETESGASSRASAAGNAHATEPRAIARDAAVRAPFRGRVVDVRTNEPVAGAVAVCGSLEALTDSDGRFEGDAEMPATFDGIDFHSIGRRSHIRSAARGALEWLGDEEGWLARIRIGPTFRFGVVGAASETSWRLRVVEQRANGDANAWDWVDAVAGDPPWARYDNPQPEPPAGTETRIEVENEAGTLRGSARLSTVVGIHPGVLLVEIDRRLACVTGRVVDGHGRPREKAAILAVPRDDRAAREAHWPAARTDDAGRYALRGLADGSYWIHASPRRGEEPQSIALDVRIGENAAPDIVVPAEEHAGAIGGMLESMHEAFPSAMVRLRAVDGRRFDHFDVVDPILQASNGELLSRSGPRAKPEPIGFFEFQRVPAGEYELIVMSGDGRRWTPTPLRVRPPRRDLEIVRDDATPAWHAAFDVRDAETGAAIDDALAQFELDDCWTPQTQPVVARARLRTFVAGTRVRWNVQADGYRLASGTEGDFVGARDSTGTDDVRVATVTLARGFGARLLLRDANGLFAATGDDTRGRCAVVEHAPVAGIPVFADGELVATSDAHGEVVLALAHEPSRVDVRASGWVVLGSEHFRAGRIVGDTREAVVWLTRP